MPNGTRCHVLTDTHAIDADFADEWVESIGQSLNQAMQTDKKDGIVFVLKCGDGETREQQCQTVLFTASDQRGHDPPDLACVYWTIHIDTPA